MLVIDLYKIIFSADMVKLYDLEHCKPVYHGIVESIPLEYLEGYVDTIMAVDNEIVIYGIFE